MTSEQVEHVIEEPDAGLPCASTVAIEVELKFDVGFLRLA
jgi:glutamine phosphoribosylpyrophosphate amidotransferase